MISGFVHTHDSLQYKLNNIIAEALNGRLWWLRKGGDIISHKKRTKRDEFFPEISRPKFCFKTNLQNEYILTQLPQLKRTF